MLDSKLLVNGLNFVLSTLDHHLACQIFLFLVYDKTCSQLQQISSSNVHNVSDRLIQMDKYLMESSVLG